VSVTPPTDRRASEREGRRLALGAVFEADFGMRTPQRVLERRLEEEGADPVAASLARTLVDAVAVHRDTIDAEIERRAPQYPVVQLARIDRALLRSGMGELLHCPATPTRVAVSEWVEMARTYSGESTRRLVNGVLGQVANASSRKGPDRGGHAGPETGIKHVTTGQEGAPQ
jgi:N utilization substance protein B